MKRLIYFYWLLVLTVSVQAQTSAVVPGYLGKKLYANFNVGSSLFFDRNLFEETTIFDDPIGSTRLSLKYEASLNYTVSRKVAIGGSIIYARQKGYYGIKSVLIRDPNFPEPYVNAILPSNGDNELGRLPFTFWVAEFHAQFFRRNFIAPVGLYHQVGIGYLRYSPIMTKSGVLDAQAVDGQGTPLGSPLEQELDNKGRYYTFRISYQRGRITPLNKHFYLNTAFGINLNFAGNQAEFAFANGGIQTFSESIISTIYTNIRRMNTFEVKIGLGWFAW
jgi:hypothetical protein